MKKIVSLILVLCITLTFPGNARIVSATPLAANKTIALQPAYEIFEDGSYAITVIENTATAKQEINHELTFSSNGIML